MQFKGINPWINMKSTRQPIAGIESPKAIDANDNTIEIDDTFFRMMSVYVRLHCSIKTTNIRKIQFRIVLKMSDCLEWSECERERRRCERMQSKDNSLYLHGLHFNNIRKQMRIISSSFFIWFQNEHV